MRNLADYFECEGGGGAMPSNTLGAGNPGLVGPSTLTEPLTQGQIDKTPTAKTKKEKKKTSKTKPLKEYLNETL